MIFLAAFDKPFDQRIFDRRRGDDARSRRAALAGGAKGAAVDGDGGLIEIGVGHDDDRVLTAHLAGDFGAALRRFGIERAADFIGAGKGDGSQHRRVNHRFADDRAGADQHVEYARRQAGFGVNLRKQGRCGRRQFSGFEDDTVTRGQSRCRFPNRNRPGKIPRRDQSDDAKRAGEWCR